MSLTAQVLREVAERIRLRCPGQPICEDCGNDVEILERIAAQIQASFEKAVTKEQ